MNNINLEIEKNISYTFADKSLLEKALYHSSFVNESGDELIESNERLEFLGDSVIGLLVTELLFKKLPNYDEGALTALKSRLVNTESLSTIARAFNIGEHLKLGKGAEKQGESDNDTLLENAFEAIAGAIYLDGGFDKVKIFLSSIFEEKIREQVKLIESGENYYDYKTALQIHLQKNGSTQIKYEIMDEYGPEHEKTFRVSVNCEGIKLGEGEGKTKKTAEQKAAKKALEEIKCT